MQNDDTLYTYRSNNGVIETYSFLEALKNTIQYSTIKIQNNTYFIVPEFSMLLPTNTDPISIIRALSLHEKIRILHKRKLSTGIHVLYNDCKCQVCHQKSTLRFTKNEHKYQVCDDHIIFLTELFEHPSISISKQILQRWNQFDLKYFSFWAPELVIDDIRKHELGRTYIQQFKSENKHLLESISRDQIIQHSHDFPDWLMQALDLV